jgi:ribose-phosphate pyrophosphokinase
VKLFGIQASIDGARGLAAALGIELAPLEEREFEDGEFKIRPLTDVRGQPVIIYQGMAGDAVASANDKLVRALFLVGTLKDAGAASIRLVAPYLAYARKDRRTKLHDPVSIRYLAQAFEAVGVDEVVTVTVHNPAAFENAFRCRALNVEAEFLFARHFALAAAASDRIVVVSPDTGGTKRARRFADLLAQSLKRPVDLAFVEKYRSEGRVSGDLFAGDVRGALAVIYDDLISGGTTMRRAASICLAAGANKIQAAATHGLFTPGAARFLGDPAIDSVVVTDTIGDLERRASAFRHKLVVLDSAPLLAEALR